MFWSKSVTLLCLASTPRGVGAFTRSASRAYASTALRAAASDPPPPPINYMLTYDYIPDVLEKRGPFRAEHLQLAKDMTAAGTCVLGGPFAPTDGAPPTGALFVFTTLDAAQDFVDKDPYVSGGIVTAHKINALTVAVSK